MTPQELDERIAEIEQDLLDGEYHLKENCPIKQLIKDCIESVTPRKVPDDGSSNHAYRLANWHAIDTINKNTKELLDA